MVVGYAGEAALVVVGGAMVVGCVGEKALDVLGSTVAETVGVGGTTVGVTSAGLFALSAPTVGACDVIQVEVHYVLDDSETWLKLHQKHKIGHPAFVLMFVWSLMHGDLVGIMTDGWKQNVPWDQLGWHKCLWWVLEWKNHVPPWQELMGGQQFPWV